MSIRVLVVDDDPTVCTVVTALLRAHEEYQVIGETNSHHVMGLLHQEQFHLVLLDVQMPGITGMDLLHQIKQTFTDLPVIMLTGYGNVDTAAAAIQAGAADFITKPVESTVLHIRVQKALEHAQTQRLASTDGLTGLYNYRTFQERLEQEVDRANRYHRPLSLIMIDVDWFKLYNDTHGHLQGDAVLTALAHLLRDVSRASDTVVRYGGEEFAVILPETDLTKATQVGNRLRERVESHPFPGTAALPGQKLTISVGVAAHTSMGTKEALLQTTDQALYAAKRAGRNCVWVAA